MKKYEYKYLRLIANIQTEKQLKIQEHEKDTVISMEQLNNLANEGWRVIVSDAHKNFIPGAFQILLERERIEEIEQTRDPLDAAIEKAMEQTGFNLGESEAPTVKDPFATTQLKK